MESAGSPHGKAREPEEEAQQPRKCSEVESINATNNSTSASQKSRFSDILSQPAETLRWAHRLHWLQKHRGPGLWVQCDECQKWRYLPHVLDAHQLPKKWYCRMNPDNNFSSCSSPEVSLRVREEEDLIHSEYSAGSLVWAQLAGWPWWPAMVADCPDTEQFYWVDGFSDIPTYYNVVFFDNDVTRAWLTPNRLKPYDDTNQSKHLIKSVLKNNKSYRNRLQTAIEQANDAKTLPVADRLEKYSFIARYKGAIRTPKKTSKHELLKYQKLFKRKFNVEFPIESSSSEEETLEEVKKGKV